ncbi:MAG TPA: cytochrome c biogenesis protein CcsA [Fimbriimonadaceae bacterium]|nr:cytochrome c biogenesis protein CcsA [Fimbriimonadaceae bacterium]
MFKNLRILFALAVAAVTIWSFMVPDAVGFQRPELARIFFWHFPCPMLATLLLILGAWFSFRFTSTKKLSFDVRAVACMELGYLFCILTMATGILFSYVQWGAWWQNDPRQTSFLMVLLIYAAYFGLRGAIADPVKRGLNSGVYALAALLPTMFLTFVFPRLPQVQSFHPSDSIMKGNIKGQYAYVVIAVLVLMVWLTVWMYRLRVRAGTLELNLEEVDDGLETNRGDTAGSTVVRPVRVPRES